MKSVFIALAMMGSTAFAWTVDYGPGSYVKATKVCYKGTDQQCQVNRYRYYKPRMERVCTRGGHDGGGAETCYNRLTTGNYGSFKGTRKEWEENFGSHGGGGYAGGRN